MQFSTRKLYACMKSISNVWLSNCIIILIVTCGQLTAKKKASGEEQNSKCEWFDQTPYLLRLHGVIGTELSQIFEYHGTVYSIVPIYDRLIQIHSIAAEGLKTEIQEYLKWNESGKECFTYACKNLRQNFPFHKHMRPQNLSVGYSSMLYYEHKLQPKSDVKKETCFKTHPLKFDRSGMNTINLEYKDRTRQTAFNYLSTELSSRTELFILNSLAVSPEFLVDFKPIQNYTRSFIDITGEEKNTQWYHKHSIDRYYLQRNGYNWTVYIDELNGDFNFWFVQFQVTDNVQRHFERVKNRQDMRNIFNKMGNFTEFATAIDKSRVNATGTLVVPKIHHSLRIDLKDEILQENIPKLGDENVISDLFVNHSSKLLTMEYSEYCYFKDFEYDLRAKPDFVMNYPFIGMLLWKHRSIPIKTVIYYSPPNSRKIRCY